MSIFETSISRSRGRSFSTWSNQFYTRQPPHSTADNELVPIRPGQTESDAFIHAGEDNLSPPCFNWKPLDLFLRRAHLGELTGIKPCLQLSRLCLIDDRSHSAYQSESLPNSQVEQQLHPEDGEHTHGSHISQRGVTDFRKNINERELYHRLLEKASRRVLYVLC
jgi:hypothetical protein